MIGIFKSSVKARLSTIIFFVLIALIVGMGYWYSKEEDAKLLAILGSLVAGIIVALIQFLIAWQDYSATEKLKQLQIKKVLLDRDKRDFYENYINSAKKNIDMMGVTGSRFMDHFANNDENAPSNSKVLLGAMGKGVKVRILMPDNEFLFTDEERRNETTTREKYRNIREIFPNNFEVRYFKHVPAHSIFLVDDECILGPIFPMVSSKFTPALYLKSKSPFAEKYLDYFNSEWTNADEI
jgi:lipopolysaccharide export LptBFGC system permease protein LptF